MFIKTLTYWDSLSYFLIGKLEPHKNTLEHIGSRLGIAGALFMSFIVSYFPELNLVAWSLWLVSTVALLAFTSILGLKKLKEMYLVYTAVNISGVINSIIALN